MNREHVGLYSQVMLIHLIASESIKFFNNDIPEEKRRNGLRLCFTDRETGEDVLNLSVGEFPLDKSDKYFNYSRMKAKYVSGRFASDSEIPLTSFNGHLNQPGNMLIDVPQGGVRGFYYGLGGSGQKGEHDEAIAAVIICMVERLISSCEERKLLIPFHNDLKLELILNRQEDVLSSLINYLANKLASSNPNFF